MKHRASALSIFLCSFLFIGLYSNQSYAQSDDSGYAALVSLFQDWRTFETPPVKDGAPDSHSLIWWIRRVAAKRLETRFQYSNIQRDLHHLITEIPGV